MLHVVHKSPATGTRTATSQLLQKNSSKLRVWGRSKGGRIRLGLVQSSWIPDILLV